MAQTLNFQPISLQQTLWDQKQLEALCAPRIMPPWEKYHANDNYGFATILKAYSGHPFDKSLPVLLTHGVYFDDQRLYDMERQCGLPGVMSYPDFRTKLWREQTDLRVIPSASPLLYAQRLMDQHFGPAMPEVRSGSIYFLPHSTGHIKRDIDLDQVITKLKGYCQQQEQAGNSHLLPLSVCIHWQDITHGKHRPFKKAGLPVISAGHLSDPDFLFRLLHLLRLSNLALGAFPGGHVFASLVAGVPFIAWEPAKAVAEVSAKFKNTLGSQRSPELSARIKHWESLFQPEQDPAVAPTPSAPITAAQQGFADMMLGREDLLGPDELFALLRSFGYPFMSKESRRATDAHFRQRYAENPQAKDCFARLAEGYAHLNNWPAAFELIEQDRKLGRLTPRAELRTAQWLQRMGQAAEAEMLINKRYAEHPVLRDGFTSLAQTAIQSQDWDQAVHWLQKDAAADRLSPRWWMDYAEMLMRTGDDSARTWIERAYANKLCSGDEFTRLWWPKMQQQDWPGALALAERDLAAGRLSAEGKLKVADLYERCGQSQQALALIDAAYADNRSIKNGSAQLAWTRVMDNGDWQSAHDWFLRDLAHDRLTPEWKKHFALAKAALGFWDEARSLIESVYAEAPQVKGGFTNLGYWGYLLGRGTRFFREQYQRDLDLDRPPPHDLHARLLEAAEGRVLSWDEYRDYHQGHPGWLTNIGFIHYEEGRADLAARLMSLDYESDNMVSRWWPTYAMVLHDAGQQEQAEAVLDRIESTSEASAKITIGTNMHPKERLTVAELRARIRADAIH